MGTIRKLAVFCGSKHGNDDRYKQEAEALGLMVARRGLELIYGGGKSGLMGTLADTVMQEGGVVRGVIPRVLTDWEHQHEGITELLVVDDMHVRKRKLYELCDAAVVLPGGFGTLDELFEILTWNQLSIHDKRIFILNTGGFYNHLLAHMQALSDAGFLYGRLEEKFTVLSSAEEMEGHLG